MHERWVDYFPRLSSLAANFLASSVRKEKAHATKKKRGGGQNGWFPVGDFYRSSPLHRRYASGMRLRSSPPNRSDRGSAQHQGNGWGDTCVARE